MTNTSDTLAALARAAGPGATVSVPAGDYPPSAIGNVAFDPPVTLVGAGVGQTRLAGLHLQNASGVVFKAMSIQNDPVHGAAVVIEGGAANSLLGLELFGTGVSDGAGVRVLNSSVFTLADSELHHLGGGAGVTGTDHSTVVRNRFHDIEVDAIQHAGCSFVTVDGNAFTDFFPAAGDHSDCIQFFTFGTTKPSTDLTITNNTYTRGKGPAAMQGVFMNNEAAIPYERVTIRGNAIVGGVFQGIAVELAKQLVCDDNLVLAYEDAASWLNVNDSPDAVVSNNRATTFLREGVNDPPLADGNLLLAAAPVGDTTQLDAWLNRAAAPAPPPPPPVSPPPPPPPPPPPAVDPRDAQIKALGDQLAAAQAQAAKYAAGLNTVITLGTAANAKRPGPTKADMSKVIAAAKTALQ